MKPILLILLIITINQQSFMLKNYLIEMNDSGTYITGEINQNATYTLFLNNETYSIGSLMSETFNLTINNTNYRCRMNSINLLLNSTTTHEIIWQNTSRIIGCDSRIIFSVPLNPLDSPNSNQTIPETQNSFVELIIFLFSVIFTYIGLRQLVTKKNNK